MRLFLALLALVAGLVVPAEAQRRYYDDGYYDERVPPRWNSRGSAVCPEQYDYVEPWCVARSRGYGRDYGYGRPHSVPPRWNSQGSAVCPDGFDYDRGSCRPRGAHRLPPSWNSRGSVVCPSGYEYRDNWCRPQHRRY